MISVDEIATQLVSTVEATSDLALSPLGDDELLRLCQVFGDVRERLGALLGEAMAAGQQRGAPTRLGHRTMEGALAAEAGHNAKRLLPLRRDGEWLVDFPILADAYRTGLLNGSHIDALHAAHNNRVHHQMVEAQAFFVKYAQVLRWPEFKQALQRWLATVDQDGPEPSSQNLPPMKRRYGLRHKERANGDVEINGLLPPLEGEAFVTALEAETKKLSDAHDDSCDAERIPWRQLRIHGLIGLVSRGYAAKNPGRQKPLINVVLSEDRLGEVVAELTDQIDSETVSGADPPWPEASPFDQRTPHGRCETIRGTPIKTSDLTPYLASAVMRRHIMSAKGRVLEVAKDQRFFPEWIANALLLESRGLCSTPGCCAPLHWLHTDHITPSSVGGETVLDNGRPLCSADNRWRGSNESRGPTPKLNSLRF